MSVSGVTGASGSDMLQSSSSPAPSAPVGATQEMFLKLLVAQIKNQNPLSPADGVQFLSQLAQFSQLEQTISIREGIDGLRADLGARAANGTGNSGGSNGSNNNTGNTGNTGPAGGQQ